MLARRYGVALLLAASIAGARAGEPVPQVVDLSTRPGVVQRFLYLAPAQPRAAAILFAGGEGDVGIGDDGQLHHGGNFLVRSRGRFVAHGIAVAVIDPPSDRPAPRFLANFRDTQAHADDMAAIIAWLRRQTPQPVWLIGTSRGTQSAAQVALHLSGTANQPDGVVLTSTILQDAREAPVSALPLSRLTVPVLVVHHRHDECRACPAGQLDGLMARLDHASRKALILVDGGTCRGDPCEAHAHHGYNGIEDEVVERIVGWMLAPTP